MSQGDCPYEEALYKKWPFERWLKKLSRNARRQLSTRNEKKRGTRASTFALHVARHARAILTRGANAELCYELFGSYLLKNAKDLVTGFLDKTGVPHKEGMIDDVENDTPAGDKVAAAVAELDKEFDPADVTLYLSLAAEQWPSVPEVDAAWQMRA